MTNFCLLLNINVINYECIVNSSFLQQRSLCSLWYQRSQRNQYIGVASIFKDEIIFIVVLEIITIFVHAFLDLGNVFLT